MRQQSCSQVDTNMSRRVHEAYLELEREGDAVGELLKPLQLLDVLEALEVQCEHVGQPLDAHALLRLLQAAQRVARH